MTAHPTELAKQQAPEAAPETLVLAVDEMHCGACLRSVERAALRVPGVESARASLAAKRLTVTYDPKQAGEVDVIAALDRIGFSAAPIEAVQAGPRRRTAEISAAARGGGGLRRHEHHAAVDLRVVRGGGRHGPGARLAVPLAVGADRAAHRRLCGPTVLRVGLRRAQGPAAQHGRADLARHHPGDGHEPLSDHAQPRAGLFRCRRHAAVLPAGRALSRRVFAGARAGRGAEPAEPAERHRHGAR